MSNKNDNDHSLLDDFTTNMSTVPEKKLMSTYQICYIILSLIPFTIYRIAENIFLSSTFWRQAELQFSLLDFDNFCKVTNELSYKLLAISVMLILSVLIMSFISILKVSKYKIKKEDIKKFKKGIIVLQLIITSIIIFFLSVDYINAKPDKLYIDKYERLANQNYDDPSNVLYEIKESENKMHIVFNLNFATEIILEIVCSFVSIKFQNKIIEKKMNIN